MLTPKKIHRSLWLVCMMFGISFMMAPKMLFAGEQPLSLASQATPTVTLTNNLPDSGSLGSQEQTTVASSAQPDDFNHLYIFSIGGLVVLFLLWTGLAAGPVWFLIFAIIMHAGGWLSFPLQVEALLIEKIILYFILLKIAFYILGVALKFLIGGEDGDAAKTFTTSLSTDVILIVAIIWFVVNGVFVYAPVNGRWILAILLIILTICVRIPIKFISKGIFVLSLICSLGCFPALRPLYVLISVWVMSVWL